MNTVGSFKSTLFALSVILRHKKREFGGFPVGMFICCLALTAGARDVTYDAATGGTWSESTSWVEGVAPERGDTILIPADARLTDADGATAALASQITIATNATLTVENEGTITLSGYVSGDGCLVKKGAGLLDYTKAPEIETAWGETKVYRLAGGLVISNGTVRFPAHTGAAGVQWHTGPMSVFAPGVLDVAANCNFRMECLTGDGTILNSRGTVTQLRPVGTSVFDGYLCGSGIRVYTQADITFTCLTNSISYSEFATWGGRISFPRFGNRGELSPPGPNATLKIRDNGGTIRYLGEGETTDRNFFFFHASDTQSCTLDAGPTGGVTFTGEMMMDRSDIWNRLVLTGSNTVPMTIAGSVKETAPVTIIKNGSGTWFFKDSDDNVAMRQQKGIYEVQEGVLQFDSIADIGLPCSLGPQTQLIPTTDPLNDISNVVDTAFLLGTVPDKVGTLRYVGPKVAGTDRLIGVVGKGRLENASEVSLNWNGGARATGPSNQSAELVLAGDTTSTNFIANLRDGTDGKRLSVTKEGTSTWTLGGNTTFSGKLSVNTGTLAVAPKKIAYTWYKWTIKESCGGRDRRLNGSTSGDTNAGARQLRFYAADGSMLPMGAFTEDPACSVATLQPNGMTYDGDVIATRYPTGNPDTGTGDTGRNLNRLVDEKTTEWLVVPRRSPPRLDNAASWFSVVFRFPEGTPQAVAYDVHSYAAEGNMRSICAWTMSGSADGVTWYELDEQTFDSVPSGWMSNGSTFQAGQKTGDGFAFSDNEDTSVYGLPHAEVEVAAGAELVSNRPELELPLPTPLVVRPGASYGRYAGFAVPQEGVVDIRVPMTWFRVTVLETTGGKTVREGGTVADSNVQMQEFALYDAGGIRCNVGLTVDPRCLPSDLQPGFATYSRAGYNYYTDRDADKLFDDRKAGSGWCIVYGGTVVRRDAPASWIQLTMRLSDEDPAVTSYDWVSVYGPEHVRTVLAWRLEGSADGRTWIPLDEQLDFPNRRTAGNWWSDDTVFASGQVRTGLPFASTTTAGLISLRDLEIPIDLSGCSETANIARWKVCVNGVEVPKAKMFYQDGKLRAIAPGFLITIR